MLEKNEQKTLNKVDALRCTRCIEHRTPMAADNEQATDFKAIQGDRKLKNRKQSWK